MAAPMILLAFAVGYLIGDRRSMQREFARLQHFVLTSFMSRRDSVERNTRPTLFKADTPYETNGGMTYKAMLMGEAEI